MSEKNSILAKFIAYQQEKHLAEQQIMNQPQGCADCDMEHLKNGGEMIRRADGSYSQRGLWDNIRANKGSGKKPTKEMLEQERKIRAEYEMGGLAKFVEAGNVPSIVVAPGDPRIQAYRDSMNVYNSYTNLKNALAKQRYIPYSGSAPMTQNMPAGSEVSRKDSHTYTVRDLDNALVNKTLPAQLFDTKIKPAGVQTFIDDDSYNYFNLPDTFEQNGAMASLEPTKRDVRKIYDYSNARPKQQVIVATNQMRPASPVRKVITESGASADVVRKQQQLVDAGYKVGVDGIWGSESQKAWDSYQQKVNANNQTWEPNHEDLRADGTKKGTGYFGVLNRPDGGVSTEISMGVDFDGKEVEIPTLVPTLSKEELDYLLNTPVENEDLFHTPIGESIANKAVDFARQRMRKGLNPFYQEGEQRSPIPQAIKPKPQTGRMGELEHHQAGFYDAAGKEWQFVNGKLVPALRFAMGGPMNMSPLLPSTYMSPRQLKNVAEVISDAAAFYPPLAIPSYVAGLPFTAYDVAQDVQKGTPWYKTVADGVGFVPALKYIKSLPAEGFKKAADIVHELKGVNAFINLFNTGNDLADTYNERNLPPGAMLPQVTITPKKKYGGQSKSDWLNKYIQ